MSRMGVLYGDSGAHIPHPLPSLLPQHFRVQWAKPGESPRMYLTLLCYV